MTTYIVHGTWYIMTSPLDANGSCEAHGSLCANLGPTMIHFVENALETHGRPCTIDLFTVLPLFMARIFRIRILKIHLLLTPIMPVAMLLSSGEVTVSARATLLKSSFTTL